MKKAILILMILAMLLALVACGGSSGPAGTWHIKAARTANGSMTVEQSPELRDVMGDMVLNSDGTGTMVIMGTKYQITWNDSYIIGDDGTRLTYSVKGNELEMEAFGVTYTFSR